MRGHEIAATPRKAHQRVNGGAAAERRITANIDLAGRFIDSLFDNPALLDEIPDGASVVILPDDDPRLARMNEEAGRRMQASGKTVRFFRLTDPRLGPRRAGVGIAGGLVRRSTPKVRRAQRTHPRPRSV